jgi:hypothetical protein
MQAKATPSLLLLMFQCWFKFSHSLSPVFFLDFHRQRSRWLTTSLNEDDRMISVLLLFLPVGLWCSSQVQLAYQYSTLLARNRDKVILCDTPTPPTPSSPPSLWYKTPRCVQACSSPTRSEVGSSPLSLSSPLLSSLQSDTLPSSPQPDLRPVHGHQDGGWR